MSAPAAASGPVTSRLLASVADELTAVAADVADAEPAARLRHAVDLLGWVRARLDTDLAAESALAVEVSRLSDADRDPSADALLAKAVHRLLDLGRAGTQGAPTSEAGPADRAVTPADVTAYLRGRPGGSADEAHFVRTIVGGYSKRTLLVAATLGGEDTEIVLRQVPAGRQARSLAPEFAVLQAVHHTGLPVPEPMWIEPEGNALGGAFFVTRRSPGSNIGDVWGASGATPEICLEVASIFASLHRIDVSDLTTPVSPRSSPDELREMIAWQEKTLAKRGIAVHPVLAVLLAWLRDHIPPAPPERSLIHGDAAFSNLLVADGRVTCVLDWEAAHVGNPAEELAYLRPSVEPVLAWPEFLEHYLAAGGREPDPDAVRFFEVWSHVWRHIGCLWMAQNYDAGGRYAAAVAAYVHGPRFLAEGVTAAFGDGLGDGHADDRR